MFVAVRDRSVGNPMRIGVFGGTFDPIHLGHLAIAHAAKTQAKLDKILFIIAASPPHKPGESITPAEDRVAMTEAALANEPGFELSRIELNRTGPSYTADTLRLLGESLPEAQFYFIVGYDSALDMPKWRCPEEILRRARLLIAPRSENPHPLPSLLQGHCEMLVMPECNLSSSEIRAQIQRSEALNNALPEGVAQFIREKRLYCPCR
jgi:nicotinate-nucleotide adenylyltransferase